MALQEAGSMLPGTISDCGESLLKCVSTWSVPGSVMHSSHLPHFLQPTSSSCIPNRVVDPPPLIELDDSDKWDVNHILDSMFDHHCRGSGLLYLVKWKVFDN